MNQDRSFAQKDAPVKVGDELDVKIEAVGKKGDGIVKKDGFVLFVPNTNEGQEVKIKITKVLRNVGFAEVSGESESNADAQPEAGQQEDSPADTQADAQEPTSQEPEEKVEDTEDFGEEEEKKE
jgi:predicted RNA-binding protein with TRAM domain|tara:strand:+ start:4318 stop:4689 length:372 start_codon:yes stop_codon:yes gene_type:complete